jgi:hypothetical protein
MKQIFRNVLLMSALACSTAAFAAPQCATDALVQAKKLLAFHRDPGSFTVDILPDMPVKELPPMINPANKKQKFQVLEVIGFIYKGQYRMRFIYHHHQGECLLMGQEVLEIARL